MSRVADELFGGTYSGRRVLVTGHTGFKGSWLSTWLLSLGAEVTGYALQPPTDPALFEELGLASRMDHHHGDIRDSARLRDVMASASPEIVFHLAAQPLVRQSYREPAETFETNVMGTVHVLEAIDPASAILEFAQANRADHILIGAPQRSLLGRLLVRHWIEAALHAGKTALLTLFIWRFLCVPCSALLD